MKSFKVSCYKKKFDCKPNSPTTAVLSQIIADKIETINADNIDAFIKLVGEHGCTFCSATFKDGFRKKENFEQTQLLALDFDNKDTTNLVSFEDVKARAVQYELPILFAYDTFTSQKHNKFRVLFLNDNPVSDVKVAETMLKSLTTIFPEADKQSRCAVQMYFGGKGLLHYDKSIPTLNIESLIRNTVNYLENRYGSTHYKRKVAELSKETGIALNDKGLLDVSVLELSAEMIGEDYGNNLPKTSIFTRIGSNLPDLYYRINYGENCTKSFSANKTTNYHSEYRSDVIRKIGQVCKLYNEFECGTRKLHHQELFGIATNIIHVESGEKSFKATLHEYSYYSDEARYNKWNQDFRHIKGYKPYSCIGFCPYANTCPHSANILSTVKPRFHQMERIENYVENFVSLEEAVEDFNQSFHQAIVSSKKGWHIIKAQTALGKTRTIIDFLKDTSLRVLIAVPTNILKREICEERALPAGINIIASPSIHEIKPMLSRPVWDEIETLLNSGKSSVSYINKLLSENNLDCSDILNEYILEQNKFMENGGHAITTHKRLLTMDTSKFDIVIVDEDIIFNTIVPNKSNIDVSDLKKLKKEISPTSPLARKINKVLKSIKTDEFFTLKGIPYDEAYEDISMEINIPAFCSSSHFYYSKEDDCIYFQIPVKFNPKTKFIMVSATVDKSVCEYYFDRNNMEFYECKKAKLIGTLYQDYRHSMSRTDIGENHEIFNQIQEWSGFKHTISFKKYLDYYQGDLHFGNCAGCDYMKGENINVIGTPHIPEWIYKLFAYSIGCDFDIDEKIKPGVTVEHHGWRFRFTTYDDKVLKAIQFYIIESQLEQAVGRARLLREKCTVNLFSNFPLCQSTMKELLYDNDISSDENE